MEGGGCVKNRARHHRHRDPTFAIATDNLGEPDDRPAPVKWYYEPHPQTYVYFIRAVGAGAIKIGVTSNVKKRLYGLRSASPGRLELLGYVVGDTDLERDLHGRFFDWHLRGEWFSERILPDVISLLQDEGTLFTRAA